MTAKSTAKPLCIAAGITLAAALLIPTKSRSQAAGWVPFVASQTQKAYNLSPTGEKQLIQEGTGVYMQRSDGSFYERRIPLYGSPAASADTAIIFDGKVGRTYSVNYSIKEARVVTEPKPGEVIPVQPPTAESIRARYPSERFLGSRIISGIQCEGWYLPGRTPGYEAEKWVAPSLSYATVMLKVTDHTSQWGFVTTLENIQGGKEPDGDYFNIPKDFAIKE